MNHMEQKKNNIDLEIVLILLRKETHLREIGRILKIPHSTISRKINSLIQENVVDYKQEGKNKAYFLKQNIEAKTYVFRAENYKLINILKKYPFLRNIIEKIQNNKKIKLAILFGSYAKYSAKENSDIDIYIETKDSKIKKEIELINTKLSVKIGSFDSSSLLVKEIIKDNVILKGVEQFYERIKLFE